MPTRLLIKSLLVLGLLAGCSTPGGQLQVTRSQGGQTFSQTFDEAYVARDSDGDFDLILVSRSTTGHDRARPGEVLQPAEHLPVRYVVHAHVFWRPKGGGWSDDPATSNAAVNWYVLTSGATAGEDVLMYRGAGYVAIHPGDDAAGVTMRNIRIEPQLVRGAMTDPIGNARVSGNAHATADRQKVRAILDELKTITPRNDR